MASFLYLLVGYPGSGKTTVSKLIHDKTGAVHLWADQIRKERFIKPNYGHAENTELYNYMNEETARLLSSGQSVIFDTNFNFFADRQRLRSIAKKNDAKTAIIWVKAPLAIAKKRATSQAHNQDSRVLGNMSDLDFERLSGHLEEPRPEENPIIVDGTVNNENLIGF
ncbi:MAG: ATP-binding protein [Candidatus Saccharibacteria bacterium]